MYVYTNIFCTYLQDREKKDFKKTRRHLKVVFLISGKPFTISIKLRLL